MASRQFSPGYIVLFDAKFGPHSFAQAMAWCARLNLKPLEGRCVALLRLPMDGSGRLC
jgi:hypothetical protein